MEIKRGAMVKSKAGRDKGRMFLVIDIVDGNYALISDGNLRRIEKPKKKKILHLEATGYAKTSEVFEKEEKLTNSGVRKIISSYLSENQTILYRTGG